jgi:cbb3-type cytochrome oxidase subunit 3
MRFKLARNALQKLIFAGGVLALLAVAVVSVPRVYAVAVDCDTNAIMKCGFQSTASFVSKVKANDDGYGHHDLQTLFAAKGLSKSDYDRFLKEAKTGYVYRDSGKLVVDGQTVATDMKSLGRTTLRGNRTAVKIGGETYYYSSVKDSFLSSSLPAKVLFDDKGEVQFATLMACGNPTWGTNVKSSAKCDSLKKEAVSGTIDTFNFSTATTATGNAKITKCVYDFGDGTKPVTSTSCSSKVKHTFAEGTFTVKVTTYATVPGGGTITDTCETVVTVTKPYYECVDLKGPEPEGYKYTFIATLKFGNGATPKSADFTFGDGSSATVPAASATATTITTTHTYAKAGTYSITALVHFTLPNGQVVTANACSAVVKPSEPPVAECKPGIPVGDVRCNPCPTDSSITADNPKCTTPATTLPNTGAGNVIAIGSAALVGGFLFYRQWMFRKHKREAYQAETGASPLPLADPLATSDPLAETPLEPEQPVRSTFRRRRQF